MAQLTPTQKGSFIAGIALWILVWLTVFKLDEVGEILGLRRLLSADRILESIHRRRSSALLLTEGVNYATHGMTQVESVCFALGGTLTNVVMIYLIVPLLQSFRRSD